MPSLKEVRERCLAVCRIPNEVTNEIVCSYVERRLRNGPIFDTDCVEGIESRNFKRLVLLCSSTEDVDHICKEVKNEEIRIGNRCVVVKYQKALACELPNRWEHFEIPGQDSNYTQFSGGKTHGNKQTHVKPRRSEQQQIPPNAWPQGPYGKISGFYQNIPMYSQENKGQMHEGMTQGRVDQVLVPGLGLDEGVPHKQGNEQKLVYPPETAEHSHVVQHGLQKPHIGPEPLQKRSEQQRLTEKDQQQIPQNLWPIGPSNPHENADEIREKMAHGVVPQQMPVNAHGQDHPPVEGSYQQHNHPSWYGHVAAYVPQPGQQQNLQFDPGQIPFRFPMYGIPPGFQPNQQNFPAGQNMPLRPGMPMHMPVFTDQRGQMFSEPGYQNQNRPDQQVQGIEPKRYSQQEQTRPITYHNDRISKGRESHPEILQEEPADIITDEQEIPRNEEKPTKIVVSNLPSTVHNEYLEMFFENTRKFGGGPVLHIDLDEEDKTAVVEFKESKDLDHISHNDSMSKDQSVNYSSDELKSSTDKFISELECQSDAVNEEMDECKEEPEMSKGERSKIIVSNLPSSVDEEYLEMFFENKNKCGGGTVFHIDLDEETATAVVEFEEPEAVDIVLNKCPLMMMRQKVEVSVFKPQPFVPPCTIEITGSSSVVCEDQLERLEMYFESERRSGGGDVVECSFDTENSMALVTFGNEEVAQRVVERGNHKIKNENLKVKLHTPTKKFRQSKMVDKTDKAMEESVKTIKVNGVDKVDRDSVQFYFENNRRSGGGEIEKVRSDEEDYDVIYITFKNKQVAENVVQRSRHRVAGKELSVSLYVSPLQQPVYENKILIKGFKAAITKECLFNFIEAKSGYIPVTMDYHTEQGDVVVVTFAENPDLQKLEKIFGKAKLEGSTLKLYPVPISNCIIVYNLTSDITKDTVAYYFENTRKSGGGAVEKVVMNDNDTCLVYFADYKIVDSVLDRKHVLSNQQLDVKRYQEWLRRPEGEVDESILNVSDRSQGSRYYYSSQQMEEKKSCGEEKDESYTISNKCRKPLLNADRDYLLGRDGDQNSRQPTKKQSQKRTEVQSKNFDDSIITKMDDLQIAEIKAIAKENNVDTDVKAGKIQMSGMAQNLMNASGKIHGIMRDVVAQEKQRETAEIMSCLVQWFYIEITEESDQKLVEYDKTLNFEIESAFKSQEPTFSFIADDKEKYTLDFKKMQEYAENDAEDVVNVIRRDLFKEGASDTPASWGDFKGNLKVVNLPNTDPEYLDICQKFQASAGARQVKQIQRIQNKTLWNQYHAKKKQLADQNQANTQNEHFLWHGTAEEAVDSINAHGFNRSYCGKNATALGNGVYFAVQAAYSCQDTYSRPDGNGFKRMYYCRVLTGEYTGGSHGMRVPPPKPTGGSNAIYDSVVDNVNGPGIYVIFNDTQAFPEYLVTFS